jgi:integrase/recombinase XerD
VFCDRLTTNLKENVMMGKKGTRQSGKVVGDASDPQGMTALAKAYLEWGRVHNYSTLTTDHHLRYLNAFIKWTADRGIAKPSDVTKPILERYQRWLFQYRKTNGDPLSFSTQKCYLVPLRSWFKWLAKHNHILFNPASELELPKQSQTLPKNILTAGEAEVVLSQPDTSDSLGLRDRAILETFYSTGMRRKELIGLKLYDLDRERGTVMIRQGKGKKDRVIPIGERALDWIGRYEREARPKLLTSGQPTDLLFLTHFGEAFTLDRLSQMVKGYIADAETGKAGSCHVFRHTMATLMLENGCDIRFIQVMLGHANLKTTEIYTQVSIRKLVEAHRATHPAKMPQKPDAEPTSKESKAPPT